MKIFVAIFMCLFLTVTHAATSTGSKTDRFKLKVLETGLEGPFYDFYLGKDLNGHIKMKECESKLNCKVVVYKITPDVIAILDGQEVPLSYFVMSNHQPSTLHISNETQKLARISWATPKKSR